MTANPFITGAAPRLSKVARESEENMARLSSGNRINNARDDVSGFQQLERLSSKIKSLDRAARNAAEGVNLAKQAEIGLDGGINVLQRIRELAVQAASDHYTQDDRESMQQEVGYMIRHLEQLGERTNYSGISLLDGSFIDKSVHVGFDFRDAVGINIRDARTRELGRHAVLTGATVGVDAIGRDRLQINGITIRESTTLDDTVSTSFQAGSAIAKAEAINDFSRFTKVEAYANRTERAIVAEVGGGTLDLDNYFVLNGETFSGLSLSQGSRTSDLVALINSRLDRTGVLATHRGETGIALTAEDGRNIALRTVGNAHEITGLRNDEGSDLTTASLTLFSNDLVRMADIGAGGSEQALGYRANQLIGLTEAQTMDKVNVTTRLGANMALRIVDRSIEQVSRERSLLGAFSNRMNRTVDALESAVQQAWEVRQKLGDADVAHEAAEKAKHDVIKSALSSVISQSNAQTSKVLNLL